MHITSVTYSLGSDVTALSPISNLRLCVIVSQGGKWGIVVALNFNTATTILPLRGSPITSYDGM